MKEINSLLSTLEECLRTKEFVRESKASRLFRRRLREVEWIIEVQKSRSPPPKVTVNLGVFVTPVARSEGVSVERPETPDCQWVERLDGLIPGGHDEWWVVEGDAAAKRASGEICNALLEYALPAMARLSTVAQVKAYWQAGEHAGLTETQRQRWLAAIERYEQKPRLS